MTAAWFADDSVTLFHGDALAVARGLETGSVGCVVTSPPYFGLRDYGVDGQIGAEASPAEYVARLVEVFREVRRVLADDGTLWLNLGDSYVGSANSGGKSARRVDKRGVVSGDAVRMSGLRPKTGAPPKNLLGVPWRVAFALQDDGWILRNEIIWHKLTAMPESVRDRLSNRHEHLFLFSKSRRYHFDLDAIREEPVTSRPGALTWDRSEQGVPGQKPQHRPGRAQRARAEEIAREKGLTPAHLEAIRAVGITDTGKATKQSGTGKNRPELQALADEAKAALGGYYREFLTPAGKNPGDVWSLSAEPFPGAHFATFPSELPRRCIAAGAKPGSTVLDPFHGSGTTGMVDTRAGHRYVGIDLSEEYLRLSLRTRLADGVLVPVESGETQGGASS